ncbi:Thioredoxin domain [Dillenia turbinata]|uniref:Thioredoxin domain n=1 Tax=Dillenia turbinata TaxID=194707 RepID=A0AAN8W437_9MAGN
MQSHRVLCYKGDINFVKNGFIGQNRLRLGLFPTPSLVPISNPCKSLNAPRLELIGKFRPTQCLAIAGGENEGDSSDDDEDLCPVECVREFKTDEEFTRILEKAKETKSLVVVDFYRTSCGSCKYIEQGFAKLCRGSGDQEAAVIFLKHNVIDEYDDQSESVPLFHFYRDGVLLESFATRDKKRIDEAILKYTSSAAQDAFV